MFHISRPKRGYENMSFEDVRLRWPRIVGHMICESLGYCTVDRACSIVYDGIRGRKNWCEWLASCYDGDAQKILRYAIRHRHTHHGYMADYGLAKAHVDEANRSGRDPTMLASWF